MDTDKQEQRKVRYAPKKTDVSSNKEPHPINKKQEKEYRKQQNDSDVPDKTSKP